MSEFDLPRRLAAEALGTALLVATVVGSGIMAETLTKDVALALLTRNFLDGLAVSPRAFRGIPNTVMGLVKGLRHRGRRETGGRQPRPVGLRL